MGQKDHEEGQKDYSRTKDNFLGATKSTPWKGFESQETYDERVEDYSRKDDHR